MTRRDQRELMDVRHVPFPEYPNVIGIFEGMFDGPRRSERHSHPWAEINILVEGHGIWNVNDIEHEVGVGDGFLVMPGTPHYAKWPANQTFRTGSVNFQVGTTGRVPLHLKDNHRGHPSDIAGSPRDELGSWLLDALSRKPYHRLKWRGLPEWWQRLSDEQEAARGPYRALRIESAMLELLSRFVDPTISAPEWEQVERRGIERALRHISMRMTDGPVSVGELARVAGMSRSKFAELFHRSLGMPPHAYATALRIWMAQSGLAGSRVSAATIAASLGFSSPQHFSRAFKAATGLTPQEYRRRYAASWIKEE
ncbi:MAG: helix-turn-helix transcriptional regulator [Verrucomicrobia bacterium]|nr:helix-turn-helix transcriptional regulator [Verrucomicrobiota bacterium]